MKSNGTKSITVRTWNARAGVAEYSKVVASWQAAWAWTRDADFEGLTWAKKGLGGGHWILEAKV